MKQNYTEGGEGVEGSLKSSMFFFSCRMGFQSVTVNYLVKFKTHSKIIFTDKCTKVFDTVQGVYKGLNGFPTYFSRQYEDNRFGFVNFNSSIQLAHRKSNIILLKTDSPVNEEANDTVLATSRVADKKQLVSFGTLVSVDSENLEESQSTSSLL